MFTFWLDLSYIFFNDFYNRKKIRENNHILYDNIRLFREESIWDSFNDIPISDNKIVNTKSVVSILFSIPENISDDIENESDIVNTIGDININVYNNLPQRFRYYIDGNNILPSTLWINSDRNISGKIDSTITDFISDEELSLVYQIYAIKKGNQINTNIDIDSILNEIINSSADEDTFKKSLYYILSIYLCYINQNLDDKFSSIYIFSEFMSEVINNITIEDLFQGYPQKELIKMKLYRVLTYYFMLYTYFSVFYKLEEGYRYQFQF